MAFRMALRDREPAAPKIKLSSLEKNALFTLEKYREMLLMESGVYFGTIGRAVKAVYIRRLAELGFCRIDQVGQSTFAVFLKKP